MSDLGTQQEHEPPPSGIRLQGGALLASLQFLTLMPPIIRRPFAPAELGGAVAYFPLVGLLLGLLLAALDAVLGRVLPTALGAVLLLIAWVAMTGALHLDGFLDTCDGLLGGKTPASRLEIMRDHRIGAFALAGGVLLLLLKYAGLTALLLHSTTLLLAPLLGRWAMALAMFAFPYARPQGAGRMLKDNVRPVHLIIATALTLIAVLVLANWRGLIALGAAGLGTWALARYTLWRIPGLTGDVYGATCELVEAITIVLMVAMGAWDG